MFLFKFSIFLIKNHAFAVRFIVPSSENGAANGITNYLRRFHNKSSRGKRTGHSKKTPPPPLPCFTPVFKIRAVSINKSSPNHRSVQLNRTEELRALVDIKKDFFDLGDERYGKRVKEEGEF